MLRRGRPVMENTSVVTMFTLSGLDFTAEQRVVLFVVTLLWYCMILMGNFTLIVFIVSDKNLHEPMYVFVCNLCINALFGTVGFYPSFLMHLFSPHVISRTGCMLQGFVIHSSVCSDFTILALMAYDRYVAICRPLLYHSIMTKQRVSVYVFFSWLVPLNSMVMNSATIAGARLCGSHIGRLYCVNWMVVRVACSPLVANMAVAYFNMLFYFAVSAFILWTYAYLIRTVISSPDNRGKFMHTCLPHLVCLVTFMIAVLLDVLYIRFGSPDLSQHLSNFMALEFLIVPPLVNPLVYGFKLAKLRNRIFALIYSERKAPKIKPATGHVKEEPLN